MPAINLPEPKRRFVPSKWEAQKIAYLVKAIRKGWVKLDEVHQHGCEEKCIAESLHRKRKIRSPSITRFGKTRRSPT